jgi:hypothetical protein
MAGDPARNIDEDEDGSRPSKEAFVSSERERRSGIREAARNARREHRAHLELDMRFHVTTEDGDEVVYARARNISIGGMFIETVRPAPFGSSIVVDLALPDLPELGKLSCTVRWTNAEGMGVQFGMMGARETHGIVKLLEP